MSLKTLVWANLEPYVWAPYIPLTISETKYCRTGYWMISSIPEKEITTERFIKYTKKQKRRANRYRRREIKRQLSKVSSQEKSSCTSDIWPSVRSLER